MNFEQFKLRLTGPLQNARKDNRRQRIPASIPSVRHFEKLKAKGGLLQRIKAWSTIATVSIIGLLPRKISLLLGAGLGDAFYLSNKKRRKIAHKNLEICFPDWPVEKRHQIVREHFRRYGQAVTDLGMLWLSSEKRLNNFWNLKGLEHWRQAVAEGKPVIFFTPHFLSVDAAGVLLSQYVPMCTMMKELRNPVFSNRLKAGRQRFGIKVYNREDGMRPLIKNLLNNISCFYISDGDFGSKNSIFVPFFGVPAATLTTLGRMARLTKAVAIPLRTKLDPRTGQYDVTLGEPLENFPLDDEYANARRMNSEFEFMIREFPEQYMWTIRWFQTRPDDGPSLY